MQRFAGRSHALTPTLQITRVLPQVHCRHVGPFVFLDHFGPAHMPRSGMAVRPHPHIGLATVTVLYQGRIRHRDSLGIDQWIRPGEVNWMTAGRGIVHSERSEEYEGPFHGLQFWVALPDHAQEVEPSFHHHGAEAIPTFAEAGVATSLYVGSWGLHTSPVATYGPTLLLLVQLEAGARFCIPGAPEGHERALLVTAGALSSPVGSISADELVILDGAIEVHATTPTTLAVIGGEPVGDRHMAWNFVHSDPVRIEAAKDLWRQRGFPPVPGDDEYIALP